MGFQMKETELKFNFLKIKFARIYLVILILLLILYVPVDTWVDYKISNYFGIFIFLILGSIFVITSSPVLIITILENPSQDNMIVLLTLLIVLVIYAVAILLVRKWHELILIPLTILLIVIPLLFSLREISAENKQRLDLVIEQTQQYLEDNKDRTVYLDEIRLNTFSDSVMGNSVKISIEGVNSNIYKLHFCFDEGFMFTNCKEMELNPPYPQSY